ncbi:GNAT family N-acetyltransferase [Calidifontibacter terrae]
MTVRIVQAERDHALILGALTLQADVEYAGTNRAGFIPEFADAWLADFDHLPTWLAFAPDGSAVGFVVTSWIRKLPSLCRPTTGWLHVKNVFVVPAARGQKVAERMLTDMIAWGDVHAIERYQLNAEPKARSLYERLGFEAPNERLMVRRS